MSTLGKVDGDERSLIEIVLLANQYEGLASTVTALRIERDGV